MKAVSLLQVIYSFFLGLVVVGLVAIGINTFHPQPQWPDGGYETGRLALEAWSLSTSIILLVCATVVLAVSLWRPAQMAVISNGLLLGGIFTMIYAVGQSLGSGAGQVARFFVALAALVVTVGVGYLTFIRRTPSAESLPAADQGESGASGELGERVAALERRLEALGRALAE